MKIKICGVCRPEDAAVAAAAGADYLGVILGRKGPRQQGEQNAQRIYQAAPDLLHAGVFADQTLAEVVRLAQQLQLDVVQLHGAETPQFINELECAIDCAIWKSVSPNSIEDVHRAIDEFADHVDALLLDGAQGGSGRRFEWKFARDARALLPAHVQLVVAGGLNPENVREAITTLRPDVVDVASGVEQETGVKAEDKVLAFVRSARA